MKADRRTKGEGATGRRRPRASYRPRQGWETAATEHAPEGVFP
jgi:hypothetical protein